MSSWLAGIIGIIIGSALGILMISIISVTRQTERENEIYREGFAEGHRIGLRKGKVLGAVGRAGPQPDPITGLMPCGCGYNPELRAVDRGWYQVYCTGCDMHGGYSHTPNNVIEEWNTAMGWKGGAE